MSYTTMMENVVVSKSLITSLQSWTVLSKKSWDEWVSASYKKDDPEEIKKLTQKIIDNPQDYKLWDKEVTNFAMDVFRNKKLRDLAAMNISQQDIDIYNPYIKEIEQDVNKNRDNSVDTVSYTHLTLPTNREV